MLLGDLDDSSNIVARCYLYRGPLVMKGGGRGTRKAVDKYVQLRRSTGQRRPTDCRVGSSIVRVPLRLFILLVF